MEGRTEIKGKALILLPFLSVVILFFFKVENTRIEVLLRKEAFEVIYIYIYIYFSGI